MRALQFGVVATAAATSTATFATSGCSTQTTSVVSCTDNSDCRDRFGLGSICAADGFCEQAAVHPRCTQTFPEGLHDDPDASENYFIIGSVQERSSAIFLTFERAVELAFEQVNRRGGVVDKEFAVVFCDTSGDLADGLSTAAAVDETGDFLAYVMAAPVIIGPSKSDAAEALFQRLNEGQDAADVLFISPSATSDQLTDVDTLNPTDEAPGLFWRTAPPDSLQGNAIAVDMLTPDIEFGRDVAAVKPIAIYQTGPYGNGLSQRFSDAFLAQGGAQRPQRLPFSNTSELMSQVAQVGLDASIDEVVFISGNIADSVAFFNAIAADANYATKKVFVPDSAATPDVLAVADPARFGNTRGSRPAPLDATVDDVYGTFLGAYRAVYDDNPELTSFTASAYDAAFLAAYATAWAFYNEIENENETITGTTMARGLRKISSGTPVDVGEGGWPTAIGRFEAGQPINVSGASGELDYSPATEETKAPTEIWTISGTAIIGRYNIAPPP